MGRMAKNLEISFLLDFYGRVLTEKQRAVVEYYYNDDLSLGEIGANEGISRQGVGHAIKRAEAQLLDMEERLGLAKRFRVMKDGLEKIYLAAAVIQEWNEEKIQSPAVRENTQKIMDLAAALAD